MVVIDIRTTGGHSLIAGPRDVSTWQTGVLSTQGERDAVLP